MSQQSVPLKTDRMLYLEHALNRPALGMPDMRQISTRLAHIDGDVASVEALVRLLLLGIAASNASQDGSRPIVQPIGRIELFDSWFDPTATGPLKDQGLVLFDIEGRPLLHVRDAVIGYEGTSSHLTKAIFDELGVDPQIFVEIQEAHYDVVTSHLPYYVVVQSIRHDDGRVEWHWSKIRPHYIWD